MHYRFDRRSFVKTLGVAAGGLMLGGTGCRQQAERGTTLSAATIQRFKESLGGSLLLPSQQEYEPARQLWNGSVDSRPWGIVRCTDASDVLRCIAFAQENDLPVAVRGGGHHAAGFATVDDGIVIDLSEMREIRLDAPNRTAWSAPGVTAGLLQREAQAAGLFLPTGTVSTVGLAGLTLGGGQGWFTSKYGLTCDNLVSAEVATAGGDLVRASDTENTDLFWGLRGGGGNFGVVVSFQYRLHALSEVTAGTIAYPVAAAADVIRHWRDRVLETPDELGSMALFVQAPEPTLLIGVCYAGSAATAGPVLEPFLEYGSPSQVAVAPMSILDLGTMFDAGSPPGSGNYWRSHRFRELSDEAVLTFNDYGRGATSTEIAAWLVHYGGAFQRIPPTDTAYVHRDTPFDLGISARWPISEDGAPHVEWAREFWTAMAPFSTGGIYSNWSSDVAADSSAAAYGVNLSRLQDLKRRYDPTNLFSANFNVEPA